MTMTRKILSLPNNVRHVAQIATSSPKFSAFESAHQREDGVLFKREHRKTFTYTMGHRTTHCVERLARVSHVVPIEHPARMSRSLRAKYLVPA
jgi:hypothetical protein